MDLLVFPRPCSSPGFLPNTFSSIFGHDNQCLLLSKLNPCLERPRPFFFEARCRKFTNNCTLPLFLVTSYPIRWGSGAKSFNRSISYRTSPYHNPVIFTRGSSGRHSNSPGIILQRWNCLPPTPLSTSTCFSLAPHPSAYNLTSLEAHLLARTDPR